MSLKGSAQFKRRLRAVGQVFKPIGKRWADETVVLVRQRDPKRTGKTAASVRRRNATMKHARVYADYTQTFIDKGAKPHRIQARRRSTLRFQVQDQTVFARKVFHPGVRARNISGRSAEDALAKVDPREQLVKAWNEAG